jgi:hypothetical protein
MRWFVGAAGGLPNRPRETLRRLECQDDRSGHPMAYKEQTTDTHIRVWFPLLCGGKSTTYHLQQFKFHVASKSHSYINILIQSKMIKG